MEGCKYTHFCCISSVAHNDGEGIEGERLVFSLVEIPHTGNRLRLQRKSLHFHLKMNPIIVTASWFV